ncbi:type II toxin-antitoxin system RelE/ParE family toxin [Methylomonas paludis]|uniref:Type II toxin-antitoxin system RelE/ParE family toxin n=1 Tax=Methylomonas paludis TaxID=1173101 RepID=A0A975MR70_9GAMM|nr:type II toxin-antitoxin system RelE/ParE family toxin [Methylomonas paludis]
MNHCLIIYLASQPEGVYVLHCFQNKAQQTAQQDIELAQQCFKLFVRRDFDLLGVDACGW